MILSKGAIPSLATKNSSRALSVLSSSNSLATQNHKNGHSLQQKRTVLGLVYAIDKQVYRWAKLMISPISKTEQISLGWEPLDSTMTFSPDRSHSRKLELSSEEQSFLDNQVDILFSLFNDHDVFLQRDYQRSLRLHERRFPLLRNTSCLEQHQYLNSSIM